MPCKKSVTTSSGTFTHSETEMTRCEAKKYCRDNGAILAPITTQEDKDAVLGMLDRDCGWKSFYDSYYHIGLDVYPCGDQQERVFTNGIVYDKDVHGPLYDDLGLPGDKCPYAALMYYTSNPLTISAEDPHCIPPRLRAICLDEKTAASSPLAQDRVDYIKLDFTESVAVFGGIFCAFIGVLAFAAEMYRRNKNMRNKRSDLEN